MQSQELSWFERVKKGLKLDSLSQKLDFSRAKLIEAAVFLAIGFLIGILWKKYSQYVVAGLIFIGLLIILQYLEIINVFINWRIVQEMCGLESSQCDFSTAFLMWAKAHIFSLLALVIGISIGVKVS